MKILQRNHSFFQAGMLGILLLSFLFVTSSCNKTDLLEEEEKIETPSELQQDQSEQVSYEHYFDNQQVPEGTFDPEDQNLIIAVTGEGVSSDPNVGIIKIWAFTSEALYVTWGEVQGLPVACVLEVEEHLKNYALTSGALQHYEQTGEMLPAYEQYATNYIHEMNCGSGGNESFERALGILYKDAYGGVPNFGMWGMPFLWSGWNNQVSRISAIGLPSINSVFDKTFYRKRMATLWGIGWGNWRFIGSLSFLNDKASSFIFL